MTNSNQIDLDPDIDEKLDALDEQIEDLILDLLNVAEISFENGQEYEAVKKYLKGKLQQSLIHVIVRMQRARVFDREIDP